MLGRTAPVAALAATGSGLDPARTLRFVVSSPTLRFVVSIPTLRFVVSIPTLRFVVSGMTSTGGARRSAGRTVIPLSTTMAPPTPSWTPKRSVEQVLTATSHWQQDGRRRSGARGRRMPRRLRPRSRRQYAAGDSRLHDLSPSPEAAAKTRLPRLPALDRALPAPHHPPWPPAALPPPPLSPLPES